MPIDYYHRHAKVLATRYQQVSPRTVHGDWLALLEHWLTKSPRLMLDVGAGSGRDAAFLADLHPAHRVVAVEPCEELARIGASYSVKHSVTWLNASLPALTGVDGPFALILLSAVWMHLSPEIRPQALIRLRELLAPDGYLVISLRLVISEEEQRERAMYAVSAEELYQLAAEQEMPVLFTSTARGDVLSRPELLWQTMILGGSLARFG